MLFFELDMQVNSLVGRFETSKADKKFVCLEQKDTLPKTQQHPIKLLDSKRLDLIKAAQMLFSDHSRVSFVVYLQGYLY